VRVVVAVVVGDTVEGGSGVFVVAKTGLQAERKAATRQQTRRVEYEFLCMLIARIVKGGISNHIHYTHMQ